MSVERLRELKSIPARVRERVFGIEPVVKALGDAVIVNEERSFAQGGGSYRARAQVMMFLGITSTGKTETAKVLCDVSCEDGAFKVISFNGVNTIEDLERLVLGYTDRYGTPRKSEFAEHYDKHGGKILVVFDEIANAPPRVLNGLYDILREPRVAFNDGESRDMGAVRIIGTGNVGYSAYQSIPRGLPRDQERVAMDWVYQSIKEDPGIWRSMLESHFSEPLLARIGMENIIHYAPLGFVASRQLAIAKLRAVVTALDSPAPSWGWRVRFASGEALEALLAAVDLDFFDPRRQGASIDHFFDGVFGKQLRASLLAAEVPPNSEIRLSLGERHIAGDEELAHYELRWEARPELSEPMARADTAGQAAAASGVLELVGLAQVHEIPESPTGRVLTAFHEAGHEIVRQALQGNQQRPVRLTIDHGVTRIDGQWVHYLGLAEHRRTQRYRGTWNDFLGEIAVLLGGAAAEWVMVGEGSSGKSNDIGRASSIARAMIVHYGLSETWGDEALPPQVSVTEYVQSLSPERRAKLESLVDQVLREAKALARAILYTNRGSLLTPMALALATKGTLTGEEIHSFYAQSPLQPWTNVAPDSIKPAGTEETLPMPETIADPAATVKRSREEARAKAPIPVELLAKNEGSGCEGTFILPETW